MTKRNTELNKWREWAREVFDVKTSVPDEKLREALTPDPEHQRTRGELRKWRDWAVELGVDESVSSHGMRLRLNTRVFDKRDSVDQVELWRKWARQLARVTSGSDAKLRETITGVGEDLDAWREFALMLLYGPVTRERDDIKAQSHKMLRTEIREKLRALEGQSAREQKTNKHWWLWCQEIRRIIRCHDGSRNLTDVRDKTREKVEALANDAQALDCWRVWGTECLERVDGFEAAIDPLDATVMSRLEDVIEVYLERDPYEHNRERILSGLDEVGGAWVQFGTLCHQLKGQIRVTGESETTEIALLLGDLVKRGEVEHWLEDRGEKLVHQYRTTGERASASEELTALRDEVAEWKMWAGRLVCVRHLSSRSPAEELRAEITHQVDQLRKRPAPRLDDNSASAQHNRRLVWEALSTLAPGYWASFGVVFNMVKGRLFNPYDGETEGEACRRALESLCARGEAEAMARVGLDQGSSPHPVVDYRLKQEPNTHRKAPDTPREREQGSAQPEGTPNGSSAPQRPSGALTPPCVYDGKAEREELRRLRDQVDAWRSWGVNRVGGHRSSDTALREELAGKINPECDQVFRWLTICAERLGLSHVCNTTEGYCRAVGDKITELVKAVDGHEQDRVNLSIWRFWAYDLIESDEHDDDKTRELIDEELAAANDETSEAHEWLSFWQEWSAQVLGRLDLDIPDEDSDRREALDAELETLCHDAAKGHKASKRLDAWLEWAGQCVCTLPAGHQPMSGDQKVREVVDGVIEALDAWREWAHLVLSADGPISDKQLRDDLAGLIICDEDLDAWREWARDELSDLVPGHRDDENLRNLLRLRLYKGGDAQQSEAQEPDQADATTDTGEEPESDDGGSDEPERLCPGCGSRAVSVKVETVQSKNLFRVELDCEDCGATYGLDNISAVDADDAVTEAWEEWGVHEHAGSRGCP